MKAYIWGVLLAIDGGIYDFICYLFEIFYYLCGLQLFSDTDYNALIQRVYVILGLIMMFVLAYSLLRAVINPDEFAKGETSFPKLIQNVIVSLIIIVFLPTVFQTAFSIQNSLLNYDTIPQLILGEGSSATGTTGPTVQNVSGGRAIAFYTFKAFLFPDLSSGNVSCNSDDPDKCRDVIKGNGSLGSTDGPQLTERDKAVLEGKNSFTIYGNYSESVRDNKLTYYFPISTVAGIFMAYVMLNFCFDMALRVVKLAFYQIIAPIPVICRVIPGGKLKDVFSKWLKQVISLFVEVFVRIGALSFGVFLIGIIIDKFEAGLDGIGMLTGFGQRTIVLALLLMSVIIFVKEIPKIIGDMFGLDTGGMKLGLMDKLAAGGALAAGAVAGGALGSLKSNAVNAFKNIKAAPKGERLGAFKKGVLSMGAGTISGARRGFSAGKGAKNFADMKKAASTAVAGTTTARNKRAARVGYYKAQAEKNGTSYFSAVMGDKLTGIKDLFFDTDAERNAAIEADKTYSSLNSEYDASVTKVLDKYRSNASITNKDMSVDKWKGSARQQEEQQAMYERLGLNTDKRMSLSELNSYITRMSQEQIERSQFITETNGVKSFDETSYNAAVLKANHANEVARQMYTQLEKEAKNIIANASRSADSWSSLNLGKDDRYAVNESINKFINQYNLDGASVKDAQNGTAIGSFDFSGDIASQIKDITDVFKHNAEKAASELVGRQKPDGGK